VKILQEKQEYGNRGNRYWIEKGTTRVIRNAQKALLPIGLLKTALEKVIIVSERNGVGGQPGDIDAYDEDDSPAHEYLSDISL